MLSALARQPRTVGNFYVSTLKLAVEGAITLHGRDPNSYPNPLTFDVNLGNRPHQDVCFCCDGLTRYYYATMAHEGGRTSMCLELYDAQVWATPTP